MINAIIESIFTNDEELYNRVRAYGPGSGINRTSVTVEDATSIAEYGLREAVQDFPDTVSKSDLQTKAQEYLDAHKDPISDIEISFYYDVDIGLEDVIYNGTAIASDGNTIEYQRFGSPEDISRGDTIRIVSQELGLNTTGVIQEIDWEPGVITLSIGKPQYNLIEVIRGPEEEEERKKAALGLPEPVGLRAQRAEPGCRVFVNPYVNSRAVGVEIYAGSSASFTPSVANLQAKGANTEFDLPQLTSGQVFYFKARSYDNEGNYSDVTDAVSAVSGFVQGGRIEGGTIDLEQFVSDIRPIKIVSTLPTVISGDTDYPVGTLVNYNGALYKLISQTGTPSTDWVPAVDTASLQDNAVLNAKLADLSVSLSKIEDGAVDTAKLANLSVSLGKIQDGAVDTAKLNNLAVTLGKLASNSVDTAKIVDNAISSIKVQTNAITETKISDGSISTPKIQTGAVSANEIAANTITAGEIASSTITAGEIAAGTITASEIATGTITASEIAAGAITASEIAVGTITANEIATDTIVAGNIAAGAITASEIAAGTITASEIATDTIVAGNIAAGAITTSELAADAVTANKIAAGTITASEIATGTITANEVNTGSIRTAVLIADVIKSNMIDVDQITAHHIATGTITATQIDAGTITANEIQAGTITNTLIADSEITGSKISGGTIENVNIKNSTLEGEKLVNGDVVVADTNTVNTSRAFSVRDGSTSSSEVLRLGNISGKSGVPSSVDYGLWGEHGTGVFIKGVPTLIDSGVRDAGETFTGLSVSPGNVHGAWWYTTTIASSVSVPFGKQWAIIPTITKENHTGDIWLRTQLEITLYNGSFFIGSQNIGEGTYSDLRWRIDWQGWNPTSSTNTDLTYDLSLSYIIIEFDALAI